MAIEQPGGRDIADRHLVVAFLDEGEKLLGLCGREAFGGDR
jgi:hypothetical protein